MKLYRTEEVVGDKYGGEFPREAFRSHRITYKVADAAKSDLYLALLPAVNAGRVELLDLPELLRELRGLERRRGSSGRDKVDHGPGAGSHDDAANAVAGLVNLLLGTHEVELQMWTLGVPFRPPGVSRAEVADREAARTATEHHAFLFAEEERRQREEEQEHAERAKDFAYRVRRTGVLFPGDYSEPAGREAMKKPKRPKPINRLRFIDTIITKG